MTRIIELHTMEGEPPMAFCVGWIDGDDGEGLTFSLTSGAGCGSPMLKLSVTLPDGRTIREAIDIRDGVTEWVKAIVAEHTP